MAFLGLCQFYVRFVPHFSELASALTELNQASLKYNFFAYWKEPQEKAFQKQVTTLNSPLVLAFFDEDKPIRVEIDVLDIGMGASLMHKDEQGKWRSVEYKSKKFNSAQ
eukprot:scaffold753_cov390-Pavlova_lutheri.AAC.6